MPTMPNVVGQQFQEAQNSLAAAGVVNLGSLGYFYTSPISALWKPSMSPENTVIGQAPNSGATIAVNSPVTLTVSQPSIAVVFP